MYRKGQKTINNVYDEVQLNLKPLMVLTLYVPAFSQ